VLDKPSLNFIQYDNKFRSTKRGVFRLPKWRMMFATLSNRSKQRRGWMKRRFLT